MKKKNSSKSLKKVNETTTKWTNSGRFKLFLVFTGIVLFFVFFIKNSIKNREIEYNLVKSDYEITRGIITKMFLYKGETISVKFKIKGIIYLGSDGMFKRKNKNVGDSVYIKYYVKDPNLFITELNNNY